MSLNVTGIPAALLAALLFGASTPLAKLLLLRVDAWMLAALLYLGSGLGLLVLRRLRRSLACGWRAVRRAGWPVRCCRGASWRRSC